MRRQILMKPILKSASFLSLFMPNGHQYPEFSHHYMSPTLRISLMIIILRLFLICFKSLLFKRRLPMELLNISGQQNIKIFTTGYTNSAMTQVKNKVGFISLSSLIVTGCSLMMYFVNMAKRLFCSSS